MCIADDVTGLSVMHGGRGIVGVVASGQVEAVEHHPELVLISARFYRMGGGGGSRSQQMSLGGVTSVK